MKFTLLNRNVSRLFGVFFVSSLGLATLQAQTVYRCPDANGRLNLSDTPCVGGAQQQINPATGHSKSAPEKQQTLTPKEELDSLRANVNTSAAAREFREAKFNVEKLQQRLDGWPIERDEYVRKNKRFVKCSYDERALCEDLEHTKRLYADMSALHSQLLTARSKESDARSAARTRHFELTKKWLD